MVDYKEGVGDDEREGNERIPRGTGNEKEGVRGYGNGRGSEEWMQSGSKLWPLFTLFLCPLRLRLTAHYYQ